MKTIVILCRIRSIADAFKEAIAAAESRVEIHVFASSSDYMHGGTAPTNADLALYLGAATDVQIAATFTAIRQHGVQQMLTVYLGDPPSPNTKYGRVISGALSFAEILAGVRSILGLPAPETVPLA